MCRMKLFQVLLTTTHSRNYRRIGGEWGIESSGGTKLCENQKKKKRKEILFGWTRPPRHADLFGWDAVSRHSSSLVYVCFFDSNDQIIIIIINCKSSSKCSSASRRIGFSWVDERVGETKKNNNNNQRPRDFYRKIIETGGGMSLLIVLGLGLFITVSLSIGSPQG